MSSDGIQAPFSQWKRPLVDHGRIGLSCSVFWACTCGKMSKLQATEHLVEHIWDALSADPAYPTFMLFVCPCAA